MTTPAAAANAMAQIGCSRPVAPNVQWAKCLRPTCSAETEQLGAHAARRIMHISRGKKRMDYFKDAKTLVDHAASEILKLQAEYEQSLTETKVRPAMLVQIKNTMENLRSALDMSACGLFHKYGNSRGVTPKIYFPYATLSQDLAKFRDSNRIQRCIPGLAAARPDIVAKIEAFQHFSSPENRWLPHFMDLNNENKHTRLTPQTRKESKQLQIESNGAAMHLGEGSSVALGPGAAIRIGGLEITGGQIISTNSPALFDGPGKQTLVTWVSFQFETNNESVMPFLDKAASKTKEIVAELSAL